MRKIPVEVYSRVVGYFRPVQAWNAGKKEEFSQRETMPKDKIVKYLDGGSCGSTGNIKTA